MLRKFVLRASSCPAGSSSCGGAPEKTRLVLARLLVLQHQQRGALSFDPTKKTDEEILAYHSLYNLERETLALQDRLVKFGRKAMRQIKEDRIPASSRFRNSLPAELSSSANPSDAAIVSWFANLVLNSPENDTPALAEYELNKFQSDAARKRLIAWLSSSKVTDLEKLKFNAASGHLANLSLADLTSLRESIEDSRKMASISASLVASNLCSSADIEAHQDSLSSLRQFRSKLLGERSAIALRRATLHKQLTIAEIPFSAEADLVHLEKLYLPVKLAKQEEQARQKLGHFFAKHALPVHLSIATSPVSELEAARTALVAEIKMKREEARHIKQVDQARQCAAKLHEKGKLPDFDYRETSDNDLLAWYLQRKAHKVAKQ